MANSSFRFPLAPDSMVYEETGLFPFGPAVSITGIAGGSSIDSTDPLPGSGNYGHVQAMVSDSILQLTARQSDTGAEPGSGYTLQTRFDRFTAAGVDPFHGTVGGGDDPLTQSTGNSLAYDAALIDLLMLSRIDFNFGSERILPNFAPEPALIESSTGIVAAEVDAVAASPAAILPPVEVTAAIAASEAAAPLIDQAVSRFGLSPAFAIDSGGPEIVSITGFFDLLAPPPAILPGG